MHTKFDPDITSGAIAVGVALSGTNIGWEGMGSTYKATVVSQQLFTR